MRKKLLEVLTEKDRTDCISQVLEEHLKSALPYEKNMDADIFVPYVLNPRVDDEVLQKYRKAILEQLSEEEKNMLQKEPAKIWKWIEDKIVSSPEKERSSVITTPSGCLKTGTGSLLSKKILFVAMARTLGIPARLNPHDRSMEYMKNGKFILLLEQLVDALQVVQAIIQEETQLWDDAQLVSYFLAQVVANGLLVRRDVLQDFLTFL